jgi:hypothetical protein
MAPLLGIFAGLIGAFLYAYIDVYSPVVGVISLFVVLGLGFGVGLAVGMAGKAGHCRNAALLHGIGFLVGLVTLYFSWVFFEWVLLRRGEEAAEFGFTALVNIALSPGTVWEIAKSIAETGWYSIKSADVKGIGSWITWGLEAVMMVGLVTVAAGSVLDDAVYCETAKSWVPKREGELRLRLPSNPLKAQELIVADTVDLHALERAGDDEFPRIHLDLWYSPQTPATAAYQLQLELPKMEKGEITGVVKKPMSKRFVASLEEAEELAALADRPITAPAHAEEGQYAGDVGSAEPA